MNDKAIGKTDCPVCGAECLLKLTKKNKAYVTCGGENGCGYQGFARGYVADKKMREKARPIEGAPNVTEKQEPAPVEIPAIKVNVTTHSSEGQTVNTEETIFDILGRFGKR